MPAGILILLAMAVIAIAPHADDIVAWLEWSVYCARQRAERRAHMRRLP
jgi:hypothetical protein